MEVFDMLRRIRHMVTAPEETTSGEACHPPPAAASCCNPWSHSQPASQKVNGCHPSLCVDVPFRVSTRAYYFARRAFDHSECAGGLTSYRRTNAVAASNQSAKKKGRATLHPRHISSSNQMEK